jgi:serine O-acetyltransferase
MVMANDPIFGRSLPAAILDHADLRSAVAHQIGERLGKSTAERGQFAKIAREAFLAAPDLVEAASCDLSGIAVHYPATTGLLPPLLNFQGLHRATSLSRVELALEQQANRSSRCCCRASPPTRFR